MKENVPLQRGFCCKHKSYALIMGSGTIWTQMIWKRGEITAMLVVMNKSRNIIANERFEYKTLEIETIKLQKSAKFSPNVSSFDLNLNEIKVLHILNIAIELE